MLGGPLVFVDIDTQRDFLDPSGALYIAGSEAILAPLSRLTRFARARGVRVVASACAHTRDDPELRHFPPHCLLGTPGQERVAATSWPGGVVLGSDERLESDRPPRHLTIQKREVDVFSHPDADRLIGLYDRDRPLFVVYGVATDYCVRCAIEGLRVRGCRIAVVVDAVRAIDRAREPEVLTGFADSGVLLTLTSVVCEEGAMHDKFRKRHQTPPATERVRRQIALEAARRLFDAIGPEADDPLARLRDAGAGEYYTAKRKAAAVLGHRVRPGDLPSDSEVREQALVLARSRSPASPPQPEPSEEDVPAALADHLDRFALYKLRLAPLESVKQDPRTHPEGDALYHSLQVFALALQARPYDEEFLLAALLHDVGKAIDPQGHVAAGIEALRGAVTERTLWLVARQHDAIAYRDRTLGPRERQALDAFGFLEDLLLLRELDEAGRVPGTPVGTVEEALDYLRGLEDEEYLSP